MKISVFGQMKIRTLKDKFLDEFGVEIQVLDLNKKPIKDKGPDCLQNLSIVRDNNRGNTTLFSISAQQIQIERLEKNFLNTTGVRVRILDGEHKPVKDKTLTLCSVRNEYMSDKQRDYVGRLKSSAMFELSLASKELFHSNFIYWLGNTHPDILKQVIRGWIGWKGRGKIEEIIYITRESKNLDVLIAYRKSNARSEEDISYLVIENKVKSIPYFEQLERYSKYIGENGSGILLTCAECKNLPPHWKEVSYGEYLKELKQALKTEKMISSYHRKIIEDYIEFTNALVELLQSTKKDKRYILRSGLQQEVTKLRIHDLFLKNQVTQLAREIKAHAQKKGWNGEVGSIHKTAKTFLVESGFMCGTPYCSLFKVFHKPNGRYFAGVQLDGANLRLCCYAPYDKHLDKDECRSEKLAKAFLDREWWGDRSGFELTTAKRTGRINKGVSISNGDKEWFLEYKNKENRKITGVFLYIRRPLTTKEKQGTIGEIAGLICCHFEEMMKHETNIQKWLDDHS